MYPISHKHTATYICQFSTYHNFVNLYCNKILSSLLLLESQLKSPNTWHNHTSHSQKEMTIDIRLRHKVRTVHDTQQHRCSRQCSSCKSRVFRTSYCHVMHHCTGRNIVSCQRLSLTADTTPISLAADERLSYRSPPHSQHLSATTTETTTTTTTTTTTYDCLFDFCRVIRYPIKCNCNNI